MANRKWSKLNFKTRPIILCGGSGTRLWPESRKKFPKQFIPVLKGKTLFEMADIEPSLSYVCDYYLNIADQLIAEPEGVIPKESPDRELFSLLSDFYLTPDKNTADDTELNETEELLII